MLENVGLAVPTRVRRRRRRLQRRSERRLADAVGILGVTINPFFDQPQFVECVFEPKGCNLYRQAPKKELRLQR